MNNWPVYELAIAQYWEFVCTRQNCIDGRDLALAMNCATSKENCPS